MVDDTGNIPSDISAEQLQFAPPQDLRHDSRPATKPVGYFRDAFTRFCRNKSSVAAACIILALLLFALVTPLVFQTNYTKALTDTDYLLYRQLLPKAPILAGTGFWDGTKRETMNQNAYNAARAIGVETGKTPIAKVYKSAYIDPSSGSDTPFYDVRTDTYYKNGMLYLTLTPERYQDMQRWQDESGVQVIFPAVSFPANTDQTHKLNADIWYRIDSRGAPLLSGGQFTDIYKKSGRDDYSSRLRLQSDPYIAGDTQGAYRYAELVGREDSLGYKVRVFSYTYFMYKYGYEPYFLFGTNTFGQDLLTRLAAGARFSFMLSLFVSALNLTIGTLYGAAEGYYGGKTDLILERIADILSGVPFMVVTTLFQLHLAAKVGPIVALLFAFVLTGWIGMARTVRTQFYRYKNQEYVLAARTLGAGHGRLMFKHIFPNSLGTIITGSVLVIPSVIFSESTLTYLGIVNLESGTTTSVGTLLAGGQSALSTFPHIILFPALFISLLMISFNLFGNGLRDAFNPGLRGVEE